jgi:hypothetical protein
MQPSFNHDLELPVMIRFFAPLAVAAALALAPAAGIAVAQEAKAPAKKAAAQSAPKAGPGEKVCRYKFPSGEQRAWLCKKEEPCCAWDAISYVKCGSTITGCL